MSRSRVIVYLLAALVWPIASDGQPALGESQSTTGQSRPATGEIRLEVRDPSGAMMQASGTLQNLGTGVVRAFETDAQGVYRFRNVSYGLYRIEVSREGFAQQSLLVDVASSMPVSRTVTMPIGAASSTIDIVATTPLPGSDLPVRQIPASIQSAGQHDIESSAALDLSDFMHRRLSGVAINDNQGNPLQPDMNYRGYTASPLLGTPQGLSVYLDGVRLNQPFGDVVSWDLIPRIVIADVALVPGSNPVFGLNTLGGAVSIAAKDGRTTGGTSVDVSGGSFGRLAVEGQHGGASASGFHWYVAGHIFHEAGWRVASPSDVRQIFTKAGRQGPSTALALTGAYADTNLTGNGLQEQRLLARDYESAYTLGDVTRNRAPFFNLAIRHAGSRALTFSANAYVRSRRTETINPNLNTASLDEAVYQPSAADRAALAAAGFTGFPASGENASNTPFPYWRCLAQALLKGEPIEKCNGVIIRGSTRETNYGLSGQATWISAPDGRQQHRLTAGAGWDQSRVIYDQSTQFAYVNPDHTLTPVNAFEDGSTNHNGEPVDTRVNLRGVPRTWSLYATDVVSLTNAWSLTVSGRYNRIAIDNHDRLNSGAGPGSLTGHYVFERLNPAAGLTFSPSPDVTFYTSYGEGSRAPTTIELGCADPVRPCNLPNALVSDPALQQVVTRSVEAGLRGELRRTTWSVGWFRAENDHDLLFVASPQTGNGYFKNFGRTRRTGVEAHLSRRIGRMMFAGNYTMLSATYQSPETIGGSANSANDAAVAGGPGLDGVIAIRPGDRVPLVPRHLLKAFVDLQPTEKLTVDAGVVGASWSYARGNENNLSQPDGIYYLGPGSSPGYAVVNAGLRYRALRRVHVYAHVNNLLDRRYYTAGQLGATGFTEQGRFIARPLPPSQGRFPIVHATFYAPGAPRAAWGGLRVTF